MGELLTGSDREHIQAFPCGGHCHDSKTAGATSTSFAKNRAGARIVTVYATDHIHIEAGDDTVEATTNSTFIPKEVLTPVTVKQISTHLAIIRSDLAGGDATVKITENGQE